MVFEKFIEIFELFFKFKVKDFKSDKKGFVDYKLLPPAGSEFKTFEQVNLLMKLDGPELSTDWNFKIKTLGMVGSDMKITQRKDNRSFKMPMKEILLYQDSLDKSKVQAKIKETLDDVKSKLMF